MPKKLYEESIQQFFIDVGFIPPPNIDISSLFAYQGEPKDFLLDSAGANDYRGAEISLKDKDSQNLFSGSYMLKDQGFISCPDYQEPPKTSLNKEYQKKDLETTHSFSDEHLEVLEQEVAEFPKHAAVKSTMEPSAFIIQKDIIV